MLVHQDHSATNIILVYVRGNELNAFLLKKVNKKAKISVEFPFSGKQQLDLYRVENTTILKGQVTRAALIFLCKLSLNKARRSSLQAVIVAHNLPPPSTRNFHVAESRRRIYFCNV